MKYLFLFVSYLIGSIPNGVIIGKLFKKVDIRKYGSGNLGTTNAFRVLGKKLGILVFILDVIKPMFIPFFIRLGIIDINNIFGLVSDSSIYIVYGLCAIIGHSASIYLKFKGGKAVASGFGLILFISPIPALLAILMFFIFYKITKYVSVGSLVGASSCLFFVLLEMVIKNDCDYFYLIILFLIILLIWIKHIPNLKRLKNGTENRFKK